MNRWKTVVTRSSQATNLIANQSSQKPGSSRPLSSSSSSAGGQGRGRGQGSDKWWRTAGAVTAASAAALAISMAEERKSIQLHAKEASTKVEPISAEQISFDNRVRQFGTPDQIFNYFSSIQLVNKFGQKTVMMSPMDFYSSITPDCSIHPGAGSGIYEEITEERLVKTRLDKSPAKNSVLNVIGENGLITYNDYCFLLSLLSTPVKFIDTAFNVFDVTGDGKIEAKEFAYVATKLAFKAGGYGSYTDVDQAAILGANSGLLNYLFGKSRDGTCTKEQFKKLQTDILEEIVHIEFDEYDKEKSGRISEEDFCKFLLKKSKVPPAQKARMLKRVKQIWPSKARGVSFASFKNFFLVLSSGAELERGLFFLDVENIGVSLEEFRKVASWVSQQELSDHLAEVVFVLLDDQGQGRIFKESLGPLLFDWRQPRGYDKSALHIKLGNVKI